MMKNRFLKIVAVAFCAVARGAWGECAQPALAIPETSKLFVPFADVCIGTGKKNDRQYYFDRAKVNGDPHGQAPLLWLCAELM